MLYPSKWPWAEPNTIFVESYCQSDQGVLTFWVKFKPGFHRVVLKGLRGFGTLFHVLTDYVLGMVGRQRVGPAACGLRGKA